MQLPGFTVGADSADGWLRRVRDLVRRDRKAVSRVVRRWLALLGRYVPAMLPLLIPLLVQLAYRSLVSALLLCKAVVGIQPVCASPAPPLYLPFPASASIFTTAEIDERMAWLATVVLLVALCLGVWGMSCYWVVRCLGTMRWLSVPLLAGAAGFAWVATRTNEKRGWFGGIQNYVVEKLFQSEPRAFLTTFSDTVPLLSGLCLLLAVAAITVGLAACTTVGRSCISLNEPKQLAESMRSLQHVLFAGALLLIAAVIEFRTLFTWAAASSYSGNAEAITHIGTVAAAALGVVYAVGLAAVYFPAAVALNKRAHDRAREELADPSPQEVDAWLQGHGLVISTPKSLTTMAAVLSPLLAQVPVAALLDLLK